MCLLSAIGYSSDVGRDLAQLGALLLQALVCALSASQLLVAECPEAYPSL